MGGQSQLPGLSAVVGPACLPHPPLVPEAAAKQRKLTREAKGRLDLLSAGLVVLQQRVRTPVRAVLSPGRSQGLEQGWSRAGDPFQAVLGLHRLALQVALHVGMCPCRMKNPPPSLRKMSPWRRERERERTVSLCSARGVLGGGRKPSSIWTPTCCRPGKAFSCDFPDYLLGRGSSRGRNQKELGVEPFCRFSPRGANPLLSLLRSQPHRVQPRPHPRCPRSIQKIAICASL